MIIRFCLLILFLIAFTACDQKNKEDSKKQAAVPEAIKVVQNGHVETIKIKPVAGVSQHTNYIGTPDHPTIDGGIINAADGIPISYDNPEQKQPDTLTSENGQKNSVVFTDEKSNLKNQSKFTTQNNDQNLPPKKEGQNLGGNFQDDWATSDKVKTLLKEAAEDGKLYYVLHKIDEKGLPASVATVPMIESNYKDSAVSPKGAAGTWQLMPKTAQDYGLSDEERKQLAPSTDAALKMLDDLHKQFGNWELAFAAYNAGAQRVETALQKNPDAKSVQDLDLPKETKDYVNHIMSLNLAMENL